MMYTESTLNNVSKVLEKLEDDIIVKGSRKKNFSTSGSTTKRGEGG